MICPKCSKFYQKKSYLENHIAKDNCLKKNSIFEEEISKPIISPRIKIETELDKGFEEIISKVIKQKKEDNNQYYKQQIDEILNSLEEIKERLSILESKNSNDDEMINIKSVKKERIIMEDEIIKIHLKDRSIMSDSNLLVKYYLDGTKKINYPIRKNKGNISFFNGVDWIIDSNGNMLKDIFYNNLKRTYTKVINQKDDDYNENLDYIEELSSKKYLSTLLNNFLENI